LGAADPFHIGQTVDAHGKILDMLAGIIDKRDSQLTWGINARRFNKGFTAHDRTRETGGEIGVDEPTAQIRIHTRRQEMAERLVGGAVVVEEALRAQREGTA
jgi:hypothetical protein